MSNIPGLNTAILDFCTRLDDGPRDEAAARRELPQRDPAEYQWLRDALASIEQPEARLKKLIAVMDNPDKCTSEDDECMSALEEIMDMVEDINWAVEYDLNNGPLKTLNLLGKTTDAEVRRVAAMIVAHSSQNHERLQKKFVELKFQDRLIPLLASEQNHGARAALIFAISCVCRSYPPASAAFLGAGGLGVILNTITFHAYHDPKTTARCFRLAEYFAAELSTTAAPVAHAACRLAVAEPVPEPPVEGAKPGPSIDVTTAAAGAARAVVERCVAVGHQGAPLAAECVAILSPWAERTAASDDAPSTDHKALLEAYRAAVRAGVTATTSTNKTVAVDDDAAAAAVASPIALGSDGTAASPRPEPVLSLPAPPA